MSLVELNLRLVGSGGAGDRLNHCPEGLGAESRRQEQGNGFTRLDAKADRGVRNQSLANSQARQKNLEITRTGIERSILWGGAETGELSAVRREPVGTSLVPALIGN